jgi:hypothetical protein
MAIKCVSMVIGSCSCGRRDGYRCKWSGRYSIAAGEVVAAIVGVVAVVLRQVTGTYYAFRV